MTNPRTGAKILNMSSESTYKIPSIGGALKNVLVGDGTVKPPEKGGEGAGPGMAGAAIALPMIAGLSGSMVATVAAIGASLASSGVTFGGSPSDASLGGMQV